ncbi:MAG: TolC family protein [Myxococcales bacterium]|nr:TolC family protein [Myxococcales bacterium]
MIRFVRCSLLLVGLLGSNLVSNEALAQETPTPPLPVPDERAAPPAADELASRLANLSARPGGLTASEVGRRATLNSQEVRARQAEIAAASAELDKAFAGWFPRLTLTARYTHLSPVDSQSLGPGNANLVATPAPAGPLPPGAPLVAIPGSALSFPSVQDQYTLQASLLVPVSDYFLRISQAQAAAEHGRSAADLVHRAARLNASADAKLVYYGWARAKLSHEVARQNLTRAKTHRDAAKTLLELDRGSKADVLRSESLVASAELLVERARNLTELTEDRLRTLLRDPATARYEIGEDLLGQASPPKERSSFSSLYAEAQRQRLELKALEKAGLSLAQQKRAVKSTGYPRLDAFGNAYYANPNQRYVPQKKEWHATWDVGLQLTWTPNDVLGANAASAGLDAQAAKLGAQKEQLRDALRAEVFDASQALAEARVAISTAERGAKAAEEAYRARAEQFKLGRASSLELTDAEAELLNARLEVINARVGLRIARVKLDHALGRDAR